MSGTTTLIEPNGATTVNIGSETYIVVNGTVTVPNRHVADLINAGFKEMETLSMYPMASKSFTLTAQMNERMVPVNPSAPISIAVDDSLPVGFHCVIDVRSAYSVTITGGGLHGTVAHNGPDVLVAIIKRAAGNWIIKGS